MSIERCDGLLLYFMELLDFDFQMAMRAKDEAPLRRRRWFYASR